MFRRTIASLAPPKATITQHILSPSFAGVNWSKCTWRAPYNSFYPLSISSGSQSRLTSSFLYWGDKQHRMGLHNLRNAVLLAPTALLGLLFVLQADFVQCMRMLYFCLQSPVPQWVEELDKEQRQRESREKPGYMLKHKLGGQVSIPGSEQNIH